MSSNQQPVTQETHDPTPKEENIAVELAIGLVTLAGKQKSDKAEVTAARLKKLSKIWPNV